MLKSFWRSFNLFSYIEDITLDDLFSKKVERITLVRETSDKRTLYTTNFNNSYGNLN